MTKSKLLDFQVRWRDTTHLAGHIRLPENMFKVGAKYELFPKTDDPKKPFDTSQPILIQFARFNIKYKTPEGTKIEGGNCVVVDDMPMEKLRRLPNFKELSDESEG